MIDNTTFDNVDLQKERLLELIASFTESEQENIKGAIAHATRAHEGQERDGGIPYIVHPIRTAIFLIEQEETNVDLIVATLLHDVVEDCDDTIEDIAKLYNERVASLVQDATRERPEHETEEMKREAKPRKFRWYIAEASVDSCKIKSADVIDNMRCWQFVPADHPTRNKFARWCSEAETFYPSLTKKAGEEYYQAFRELAALYQTMPQFQEHLTGDYS